MPPGENRRLAIQNASLTYIQEGKITFALYSLFPEWGIVSTKKSAPLCRALLLYYFFISFILQSQYDLVRVFSAKQHLGRVFEHLFHFNEEADRLAPVDDPVIVR